MKRSTWAVILAFCALLTAFPMVCADEIPQPRALTAAEQAAKKQAEEQKVAAEQAAKKQAEERKAEERKTAGQPAWHAENARYRITVEAVKPDAWMILDDRVLCLPDSLDNGMEVYDEAGQKQKFYRFKDGGVQFDQAKEPRRLYVYFGFPLPANGRKPAFPNGGLERKIQNDPLILRQSGIDYGLMPEDWRKYNLDQTKKKAADEKAEEKDREAAKKLVEELEALKDKPEELENRIDADLRGKFGQDTTDIRPGNTFLNHRIYEAYERVAIAYKGGLVASEPGDYAFRITSNATRILNIDGKTLIRKFGTSPAPASDDVTVHLDAGLHPLLALYHRISGDYIFSLEWKRPGDADFRLLSERDFSPAPPVRILKLEDRDGGIYPLCRQDIRYIFHLDKTRRAALRELTPLDKASAGCSIAVDGKASTEKQTFFAIPDDNTESELRLVPPDNSGLSQMVFKVKPPDKRFFPIDPAVSMTLWAPIFLYDDERLELTREIRSRIPVPLRLELDETKRTAAADGTESEERSREVVPLPEFSLASFDRFAQDLSLKKSFPLDGAALAQSPLDLGWTAGIPGFIFDSAEFAVVPMKDLKNFTAGADGLYDHDGKRRIVPLLHRPTMHELRAWELPKTIAAGLSPVRTVLAAAEDRDGFGSALKAEFEKHGIKLEFFPWKRSQTGRDTLESLPALFNAIRTTNADRILIVPPSTTRRLILSTREESRIAAFLLQAVHDCSGVSGAVLTPPIVFDAEDSPARRDRELTAELRAFRRMYGAEFLELAHDFEAIAKDTSRPPEERSTRLARCVVRAFLNLPPAED